MDKKTNANIGFENKFGMPLVFFGDIFQLQNTEK